MNLQFIELYYIYRDEYHKESFGMCSELQRGKRY